MIINATNVSIAFYKKKDVTLDESSGKLILSSDADPWMTLPPSNKTLNATSETVESRMIEDVPVEKIQYTHIDNPFETFPEAGEGDFFIVSNIYRVAAIEAGLPFKNQLLGIGARVYRDTKSAPVGALRLLE